MNRNELMRNYWRYYRNLENKLIATSSYVEIHRDNFAAFSNEYALLLQSTGAELDNFFKVFCGYNLTDRKSINDYAGHILSSYPDVVNQIITISDRGIDLQPFAGWNTSTPAQSLNWWISFDEVKHNRAGNIKKANQENVLNMMAALLYPFLSLRSGTKRYENVSLSSFFLYNSSCRELGILQITGR